MNKKKWLPMRLVKPGQHFWFDGFEYMKIQPLTTIGKQPINLVDVNDGETAHLDNETAVEVLDN